MEMDLNSYLIIEEMIISGVVGVILFTQIKSQKEIIKQYKGLVKSYDPEKAIFLKDAEIEQLKKISDNDINKLRTEVFELANYVDHVLTTGENTAKEYGQPEVFNRHSVIDLNMRNCAHILNEVNKLKNQSKSNSNTPKA